jgi:2-iminobutanoate/2-iminopropanoate deaminase
MSKRIEKSRREEFAVKGLHKPISHYTDAVRFGDLLFVSGVAPLDENLNLVGGDDPATQTQQVFRNMKKILYAAGATFSDVLRVTVYLTRIDDRSKINPVRKKIFGKTRPASTLVEVSRLAIPGMRVEIEAIVGLSPRL